jgi:5-methylcytosine-specific restriction endonuclease McrA
MGPSISATLRSDVRHRDENRCAYCQTPEEFSITSFEIDHIVPASAGGETALDNLCLACPSCNRYKGARQAAPDPETANTAPLYHPRQWDVP